jgi:hypothetical protein
MVESCDYKNQRAYRFINPQWRDNYLDYGKTQIGEHLNQAWDDVYYTDVDSSESWIEVAGEITGKIPPKLVDVEVDLEDSTILELALMAHRSNITLNELINNVLRQEMASLLDNRDKQD